MCDVLSCNFVSDNMGDVLFCVFFFQAEDGIRDIGVTGVQTCALPISPHFDKDSRVASSQFCFRKYSVLNCTPFLVT